MVVEGDSHGTSADPPTRQPWRDAGATWWVESWWDLARRPEGRAETRRRLAWAATGDGRDGGGTTGAAAARADAARIRLGAGGEAPTDAPRCGLMFEAMGTDLFLGPGWRRQPTSWLSTVARRGAARRRRGRREVVAGAGGDLAHPGPSTVNGSVGLISNVATLPEHRGRGLASAVTDDLLPGSPSAPT